MGHCGFVISGQSLLENISIFVASQSFNAVFCAVVILLVLLLLLFLLLLLLLLLCCRQVGALEPGATSATFKY